MQQKFSGCLTKGPILAHIEPWPALIPLKPVLCQVKPLFATTYFAEISIHFAIETLFLSSKPSWVRIEVKQVKWGKTLGECCDLCFLYSVICETVQWTSQHLKFDENTYLIDFGIIVTFLNLVSTYFEVYCFLSSILFCKR